MVTYTNEQVLLQGPAKSLSNGQMWGSLEVQGQGSGYTSPPTVTITGEGSGASATASLKVMGITVNSGGSGYTSVPSILIVGGGGTGATAQATMSIYGIITVTNGGSGYTHHPTVTLSSPPAGGVTAKANAKSNGNSVVSIYLAGDVDVLKNSSYLTFKDTSNNVASDMFVLTSCDNDSAPILTISQGAIIEKDLMVGGLLDSGQGALWLNYGLKGRPLLSTPPCIQMMSSYVDYPSGSTLPPDPEDGQLFNHNGTKKMWKGDNWATGNFTGKYDTLFLFGYDGFTPAHLDLGNINSHGDLTLERSNGSIFLQIGGWLQWGAVASAKLAMINATRGFQGYIGLATQNGQGNLGIHVVSGLQVDHIDSATGGGIYLFDDMHLWGPTAGHKLYDSTNQAPANNFLSTDTNGYPVWVPATSTWNGGNVSQDIAIGKDSPTLTFAATNSTQSAITFYANGSYKMALGYSLASSQFFLWDNVHGRNNLWVSQDGDMYVYGNTNTATLKIGGIEVISAGRTLYNVVANANIITAGTVATARLGSGTASSNTYLCGNQTWAAIPAAQWTAGAVNLVVSPLFIGGDSRLYISQAGSGGSGYLTSTDWNTFNGKYGYNANATFTSISGANGSSALTINNDLNIRHAGQAYCTINSTNSAPCLSLLSNDDLKASFAYETATGTSLITCEHNNLVIRCLGGDGTYGDVVLYPAVNSCVVVWGGRWIVPQNANTGMVGNHSNRYFYEGAFYNSYGHSAGYFDAYDDLAIVKQWGEPNPTLPDSYDASKAKPASSNPFAILKGSHDEKESDSELYNFGKMSSFALGCAKALAKKLDEDEATLLEIFNKMEAQQNEIDTLRSQIQQLTSTGGVSS